MNFLKTIGTETKLLILAAIVIGVLVFEKVHLRNELDAQTALLKKTQQNYAAANDSLRITKDKVGVIEYDKLAFIANDLKDLKKLNDSLAKEVAETKGKVIAISKQGYTLDAKPAPLNTKGDVIDSVVHISSTYDSVYSTGNYRSLAFDNTFNLKTKQATGTLLKDRIGFTAVTGLKQTDKGYEIFVRPQYPNMEVTGLQGAVIDKSFFKQPKSRPALITVGAFIGWTPIVYDLKVKKGDLNLNRIGAGVSVNFNLVRVFGK